MEGLREVLEKTQNVKPITENNGVKVVSFEQQRDLAQADILQNPGLGTVKMNPDGSIARTPTRFSAVNPGSFYINRYKKVKGSLYIVTDYRAIKGQDEGRVYIKRIPAFVISRDKESGDLYLEKLVTVSDDEFIADFTESLSNELMKEIKPLLETGVEVTKTDSMPI